MHLGQTWLGKSFSKMGMEKETRTIREMVRKMSFLGGGRSSQPSTPATQTSIVREAPGIEERKIELLDLARQVAQKPVAIPAERVAGLSALEQQATRLAGQTGVGAATTAQGIAQLQAAAAAPNIQQ